MTTGISDRFDPLRAAIGLFVVLGLALIVLGAYAVLTTVDVGLSVNLAVALLSGVSLVAVAALLTAWLHGQTGHRRPRRSA